MPMRKQISMAASRTKISMPVPSRRSLERRGFAVLGDRIVGLPEKNPLDNEKQQENAAHGNRKIGDADRKEGEIPNRVVPGHLHQALAPHDWGFPLPFGR